MTGDHVSYELVDVFAEAPFAGNQLAVVADGAGLSSYQMQTLAAEFNLAETTFVTATDRPESADYLVRIFTASEELPFAGHPTLGTAAVLARRGVLAPGVRKQQCAAGPIEVTVPTDPADRFELRAAPHDCSGPLPPSVAAACARSVGLTESDLIGAAVAAGCGITFVHLRVVPDALARAHPRLEPMADLDLGDATLADPLVGLNVYALGSTDGSATALSVRSRVFVPGPAMPEDPATGSAAVGLGVALAALGAAAPDATTRFDIVQGVELGRPSHLYGRVEASGGIARACWVAGRVVPIGSGTIAVPPEQR